MRLFKTKQEKKSLWRRIVDLGLTDVRVLAKGGIDQLSVENLEETLLRADFGVKATLRLTDRAEDALRDGLIRLDHRRGWRGPILRDESPGLTGEEIEARVGRNPQPESWVPGLVLVVDRDAAAVRTPAGDLRIGADAVKWTGRREVSSVLRVGDVAWFRYDEDAEGKRPARWLLEQEPEIEGAVIVLESATGAVRGLVGGWDFRRSKFDRATQAERQVGSAFKPLVYGAGFESGFTPADQLFDAPAVFIGSDGLLSYSPRNYYRRYTGILTLRRALEQSVNVPAVKLLDLVPEELDAPHLEVERRQPPQRRMHRRHARILQLREDRHADHLADGLGSFLNSAGRHGRQAAFGKGRVSRDVRKSIRQRLRRRDSCGRWRQRPTS